MSLSAQYKDGELVRDASDRTFRYEEKTGLFTNVNGKANIRYAYNPTTQVMTELPESVTSQPVLIERKTGLKAELVAKWYLTKHKVKSVLSGTAAILDFFKKNKGFKDGDVIYYIDDRAYVFEERTGFFKKATGHEGERYAYNPYNGSMTQIPWKYSEPEKAKTYKNNKLDIDVFHANGMWDEDRPVGQFSLKGKRILFINDEREKLNEYLEIFNIDGVIIDAAVSYEDFVKRFSENKYDFIFTDMNLGRNFLSFSGMDVVRTVRRYDTKVPVIVITTVTGESIGNMWNAGFTGSYVVTSSSKTWERSVFRAKCAVWSSAPNLFYNAEGKPVDVSEINVASLEIELRRYLAKKEDVDVGKFSNLKVDKLINEVLAKMLNSNRQQFDFNDWFLLSTTDIFSFIKDKSYTDIKRKYDLFLLSGMIMDQYIYSKERPEPIEYINPFIQSVRSSYKDEELSAVDLVAVKKHFRSLYGKNDMVFDLISRGVLYEMPVSDGSEKPFVRSEEWREKYISAIEATYARLEFYLAKAKESKTYKQFNVDRCNVLVKTIKKLVNILDQDEDLKYASVCDEWLTKIERTEQDLDKLAPGRTHTAKLTYQENYETKLSAYYSDIKRYMQRAKNGGSALQDAEKNLKEAKNILSKQLEINLDNTKNISIDASIMDEWSKEFAELELELNSLKEPVLNTTAVVTTQTTYKIVEDLLLQTEKIDFNEETIAMFKQYIKDAEKSNPNGAVLAKEALLKANIPVENTVIVTTVVSVTNELKYNEKEFRENMASFLKEDLLKQDTDYLANEAFKKIKDNFDDLSSEYFAAIAGKDGLLSYLENKASKEQNSAKKMAYVFCLEILLDSAKAKGPAYLVNECKVNEKDFLDSSTRIKLIVEEMSKDATYKAKFDYKTKSEKYDEFKRIEVKL